MINYYESLLKESISKKECFVGPFFGEYGYFLAHVLPFVNWLYAQGVKVHYCGFYNQECLMIDENGNKTIGSYFPLPTFFSTGTPDYNKFDQVTNDKTAKLAYEFIDKALKTELPFFDLSVHENFLHIWYPWWSSNGYGKWYNLREYFLDGRKPNDKHVGLFTRTKTGSAAGEPWPIEEIVNVLADNFEIIFVAGHPEQSHVVEHKSVVNIITDDNFSIFRKLAGCRMILSPNSGSAYVAKIMRIPEIVFAYKEVIKRFENTVKFSERLSDSPMVNAQTMQELEEWLKKL